MHLQMPGGLLSSPPPPPDDTSMASATAVANPSPDGSLLAAAVPTTRDSVSGGASTPIEARPPVDVLITPGRDDIGTTGTGDCELLKSKPKISTESAGSNADGAAHIENLSQSSTGISRPQDVAAADLPIGPLIQQILPCRARSFVPPDHTEETAYLIIPPNVPHGFELKCSHPECEKFYKFCALCNTATIKNKFNERHSHTKREYGSRDATPASEPTISLTPKKRRKSLSRKASKAQRITTESSPSNKTSGLQLSDDKDVATNKPKARRSRTVAPELTENEEETIQLMEESKLARGGGDNLRADWKYVKKYASKTLRPAINAANSRNMKARLLRGCSARSTEELKAITMLRQEEVRKGLQSKELEWLGDKGHYCNTNSSSMERSTTLIPASLLTSDEEESNNSINGSPLQDIYDSDEDEDDDYPSDDTDTNLDSEDLTRAEEDFAVLSQESMFLCDNDQGRRNFVYIDKFASKSLKELMASLETQGYQHQTSMLVPKRKMKALLRLQDQTRRKLEDDKCYSQRVKARLIEALGREKATAIIAGPSRKPSTPVFTPSPKKRSRKARHLASRPRVSSMSISPHTSTSHELTDYEEEIIQLGEESRIASNGSQTYHWDYIKTHASKRLKKWLNEEVFNKSGGSNKGRALRGYQRNPDPHLRQITEKRQQEVHRALKASKGKLRWLGNRDHYNFESSAPHVTSISVCADDDTSKDASDDWPLDEDEEEAMRLGELSKLKGRYAASKKKSYDWEYIHDHASDGLKTEMMRREVYRHSSGRYDRMFPCTKNKSLKLLFQARQKEVYDSITIAGSAGASSPRRRFATSTGSTRTGRSLHSSCRERTGCTEAKSDIFDDEDDHKKPSAFIEEVIRLGEKSMLLESADDQNFGTRKKSSVPQDQYDFDYIWQNRRGIIQEEIDKWDIADANDLMDHFIAECEGKGLLCQSSAKEARKSLVPSSNIKEPRLCKGDKVYALSMCQADDDDYYYPGEIIQVFRQETDASNGFPQEITYLYQIMCDDGDIIAVEEFYVLPQLDYEIWTERWVKTHDRYKEQRKAKGIQSYVDKSSEATDWNATRGWWETDLTGDVRYSSIVSAMRAYDDYYVRGHGEATRKRDLNMPEEWTFSSSSRVAPRPKKSRESDKNRRNPVSISNVTDETDSSRTWSISTRTDSLSCSELAPSIARSNTMGGEDRSFDAMARSISAAHRLHRSNKLSTVKSAGSVFLEECNGYLDLLSNEIPSGSEQCQDMLEYQKVQIESLRSLVTAQEESLERLSRSVDKVRGSEERKEGERK